MDTILIRNGTLLDCTGSASVAGGCVLVEGNKIAYAGAEAGLPGRQVEGVTTIDASGGMILPGLMDTHVHLMSEGFDFEPMLMTPFSYRFYEAILFMRHTVDAGVTTVRDAGGTDLGVKKAVEQGIILGPRMQISVGCLSITGGHNDNWMPSGMDLTLEYPGSPDGRCDGVEEVRKKTREMLRAGADIIKICATGGVLSPTDRPEHTQFSPEELNVIVQEARNHGGIKVMAHAQGAEGIKQSIRAGIHSIEHGIMLDDEAIDLMLEHNTFLVPTLLATHSLLDDPEIRKKVPEKMLRKVEEVAEVHRISFRKAYQAGVKIAMGTDSGVMPHGRNLRELELMCKYGMTPMEALIATTRTAAACLGWQDRLGTLEVGKLADVVVVACNPLQDIGALSKPENICLVMKDGKIIKDLREN